MVCGTWDQLGAFWPNSNETNGGSPVGPPEPVFGQKLKRPKMTKNSQNLELAQGPKTFNLAISGHSTQDSNHGLWEAPEALSHFQ
ncbi:hypothetical protein O181_085579 [Austropuccinia psidii MF-1]|uniref:Uncharacterized protein n=1 Tax=Austropuccinia psidii MF-1 TaxID=1389203 RepID=A0A9Q3FVA8_9BASI|nr:hypothetical protein [Austropuccinia psidii MF-1]